MLSNDSSRVSAAVHAAAALLYPFRWHHIYLPLLPHCLQVRSISSSIPSCTCLQYANSPCILETAVMLGSSSIMHVAVWAPSQHMLQDGQALPVVQAAGTPCHLSNAVSNTALYLGVSRAVMSGLYCQSEDFRSRLAATTGSTAGPSLACVHRTTCWRPCRSWWGCRRPSSSRPCAASPWRR